MTFNPDEQRDAHGRWTTGGDGAGVVERHLLDPRVLDVGGDEWNKNTAERLEKEYAAVRPDIDAIAREGVAKGESVASGDGEDDEGEEAPDSWDNLSGSQQEEAEQHYINSHLEQEHDWAVTNWQENGEPVYEAKHQLADDEEFKSEFLSEFLADRDEAGAARIPYNAGDLAGAIQIKPGDSYDDDPEITFDEKYLDSPDTAASKDQLQLPGIDAPDPASYLTKEMRDDIEKSLIEKFNEEATSRAEKMDPPDYLYEEAQNNVQDAWNNMDEDEQFNYAMEHVNELKDGDFGPKAADPSKLAWPAEFDPLNLTSGRDYMRTQALAKYISDRRGAQLITERVDKGIIGRAKRGDTPAVIAARAVLADATSKSNPGNIASAKKIIADFENASGGWKPRSEFLGDDASYEKLYGPGGVGAKKDQAWTDRMMKELQSADFKLWAGWKGSSTNDEGRLLQVAAADELGGRIRDAKPSKPDDAAFSLAAVEYHDPESSEALKEDAKKIIEAAGEGVTSPIVHAYATKLSALSSFDEKMAAQAVIEDYKAKQAPNKTPKLKSEKVDQYTRLSDLNVQKNGLASTTVSPTVANNWNGTENKAPEGINKKESIDYANRTYAAIGGYEGVKAALRAKWETTQYLLDKANIPVVQAYRGIKLSHELAGPEEMQDFNPPASGMQSTPKGEVDLKAVPVGGSLTTTSGKIITKVSGEDYPSGYAPGVGQWKFVDPSSKPERRQVVLRAEVPRTAVVSVPAYGVNVKSEQEVVVAGTAWRGWDAWSGTAPTFDDVPMHKRAA